MSPGATGPDTEALEALARATLALTSEDPDPGTIAVPLLHLRNAHPSSLEPYLPILAGRRDRRAEWRARLTGLAVPVAALRASGMPWMGDALPTKADVLLLSHFLRVAQAGTGEDLYFGNLSSGLAAAGTTSVTALLNHTRMPWSQIDPHWRSSAQPRVLLSRLMTMRQEMRYGGTLASAARRLKKRAGETSLTGRLAQAAAIQSQGSGGRTALRLADQVSGLVRRLQPAMVVTTYEGHSWERLVYRAIREIDPTIICVGYSHAVLFPFSHAISTRLGHGYDPDVIVTAGQATRDLLRQAPGLAGMPIEMLGSARAIVRAPEPVARPPTCLVLPEGLVSESALLLSLASETARRLPARTFRIRLHPVLTEEMVRKAMGDVQLPGNVVWSTGTALEADLARSDMVLYRGSSAAIQATQAGLKPFYYSAPGETLAMDPLLPLTVWREHVTSAQQLAARITAAEAFDQTERDREMALAQSFCDSYFTPMQPDPLLNLLRGRKSSD